MPWWFARGLRRGVVTTRYPARPEPSAALLPTPPAFRPERLTLAAALRQSGHALIFDAGACTACGRCAQAAPGAVTCSGQWELASRSRAALVKTIGVGGEEP
jgi:hypothetical protein